MKEHNKIARALAESTLAYSSNGDSTQCVITQEYDLANNVSCLVRFVEKLIPSIQPLFKVEQLKRTRYLRATKMGKDFLQLIRYVIPEFKRHFTIHRLHPCAELLINSVTIRHLDKVDLQPNMVMGDEATQIIDVLNGCIEELRELGRGTRFKVALDRFGRSARKNFQELQKYVDALCEKHSRQLVIRIDFGYRKGMFWPNDVENVGASYSDVKAHRLKLMRYLNSKLPDRCITGFALKLEYGLEKGYHYHLLLFLDGAKVREDITIAKLIGEHWNKIITDGRGLYYNCNAFKSGYKMCGIGMLHHSDATMREGLKNAALYMTKTDCLIQFVTPNGDRAFWKGVKPLAKSSRGRPRTKGVCKPSATTSIYARASDYSNGQQEDCGR